MNGHRQEDPQRADLAVDILIIGAGPTGLASARKLCEVQYEGNWLVVEAAQRPGGLAVTDITKEGFLFDIGGHVIFSHYEYFDRMLEECVGGFDDSQHWERHQRESYVRFKNTWVPYPFQNNLCCLSDDDKVKAVNGMIDANCNAAQYTGPPANFDEWIVRTMGIGLAEMFMRPYNFKVWACHPAQMSWSWLGERVATVDVKRAVANIIKNQQDVSWGPNAIFRFPKRGGTGAIWEQVARTIPTGKVIYGCSLMEISTEDRIAIVQNQQGGLVKIQYQKIVSTIPLDTLVGSCLSKHHPELSPLTKLLKHSATHVIGIGIRGSNPHQTKCWLYFPENNCPFYRATIFSNYAQENTPSRDTMLPTLGTPKSWRNIVASTSTPFAAGPYWSIMLEVSESEKKPVNIESIIEECIHGAVEAGLMHDTDEIVSIHHRREGHGYPTPSLDRDDALSDALSWLRGRGILSRGRFGSYKYEVSNQDHCVALGVECIQHILFGTEETTLERPEYVNRPGQKVQLKEHTVTVPTSNRCELSDLPSANEFFVGSDHYPTCIPFLQRRWFSTVSEYHRFLNFKQRDNDN